MDSILYNLFEQLQTIFISLILIIIILYAISWNERFRKFLIVILIFVLYLTLVGTVTVHTRDFIINSVKLYDANFKLEMCYEICSPDIKAIKVYCLLLEELKAFLSLNVIMIIMVSWVIYMIVTIRTPRKEILFTKNQVIKCRNNWFREVSNIFIIVSTITLITSTFTSYFMPIDLGQGNIEFGSSIHGIVFNLFIICLALNLFCFSTIRHLFPVLEFYRRKIINKIKDYYERKTK